MIRTGRNYQISQMQIPDPNGEIITTIKFAAPTGTVNMVKPNLKYNKRNWMGFDFDDVAAWVVDAYNVIRQYKYTDGCGIDHPYAMTMAINGANETSGQEYTFSEGLTVAMVMAMTKVGRCDLSDHGYFHDPVGFGANVTAAESTIRMQDFVKRKFNYWTRSKTVPQNYAGHAQAAFDQGYLYVTSQGTFDTFTPEWEFAPPGDYSKVNKSFGAVRRDFSDKWQEDEAFLKTKVNDLVASNNKFFRIGSHTVDVEYFGRFCQYLMTQSNDNTLCCTTRELFEYEEMKRQPTTWDVQGDTLTITTDINGLDAKNRWKDLSFLISSDQQIKSVTTNGDSCTFNPGTGLVNVYKETIN
ncbi:hypothetical protein [Pedobacter gandavensis]|uniref:Uncharacterized protein n=1 Tax=Pedobacter gandavensis TaxID=2679963 RepID=A0ABR6EUQ1_9SPHI|nr:hypothetical protein [Pedobacter gandavensis]MBB2148782.1 hypothetical protein [Pedobacter gandavensis]